jgi:hypothetical protein
VPGGCGTPRICDAARNSPTSQKAVVGAVVLKYIADTKKKTMKKIIHFNLFALISGVL